MSVPQPLSSFRLAHSMRPFYPALSAAVETAQRDVLACSEVIPNKRKTERASDMHAALRESFRFVCDEFGSSLLELVEEPEGSGLDCVIVTMGGDRFALRWGKFDGRRIRRNSTTRQIYTQEQLLLYGGVDRELNGLSVVSLGYTVEDDYTEAGIPQWWIGRVALLRERVDDCEFIEDVASYARPTRTVKVEELRAPRIVARELEQSQLAKVIHSIRREIA